jgi:hypothetical protein
MGADRRAIYPRLCIALVLMIGLKIEQPAPQLGNGGIALAPVLLQPRLGCLLGRRAAPPISHEFIGNGRRGRFAFAHSRQCAPAADQ